MQEIILNKQKTCCFTGHRPQKLPWGFNENHPKCLEMKQNLSTEIENAIKSGYEVFWCGMALGFDMICAETVLNLKKKHPHIKLFGAVPCKNQDAFWKKDQKLRYQNLLSQLDGVRCVYNEYKGVECMHERNHFMIDSSSLVIALFDGKPGGTAQTVNYAKSQGKEVIELRP